MKISHPSSLALMPAALLLLAGCFGNSSEDSLRRNVTNGEEINGGKTGVSPDDPSLCGGRTYVGYDNAALHETRLVARVGVDRNRMKPFGALQTEYARVLGKAPASLTGAGATFGQVPARWFEEPQANAVALQTALVIAFDGCLDYTAAAPEFAAAPDGASAAAQCSAMATKFWSKTPTPQEVQACVEVATVGAASEANVRRRWAYACAAVLSSGGFLSY